MQRGTYGGGGEPSEDLIGCPQHDCSNYKNQHKKRITCPVRGCVSRDTHTDTHTPAPLRGRDRGSGQHWQSLTASFTYDVHPPCVRVHGILASGAQPRGARARRYCTTIPIFQAMNNWLILSYTFDLMHTFVLLCRTLLGDLIMSITVLIGTSWIMVLAPPLNLSIHALINTRTHTHTQ